MKSLTARDILYLVDDDPRVLRALGREIEPFLQEEGLSLRTFASAGECLAALDEEASRVSVVISDLRMPGKSGSELLWEIHETHPVIELILLTAYQDMEAIQKAVSAALHALLFKPWDPDLLITEIKKARDIQHLRLKKDQYLQEVKDQLTIAGDFQQKLLKVPLPDLTEWGLSLDLTYEPLASLLVGSDYYDIIPAGEHRLFFLLGDVTGHGIKPAFITAILKVLTQSAPMKRLYQEKDPARLLRGLNRELFRILDQNTDILITFQVLLLEKEGSRGTAEIRFASASAGNMPLYRLQQNRCTPFLNPGPPLGFDLEAAYTSVDGFLDQGDILTLFTEGLFKGESHHHKTTSQAVERFLKDAAETGPFPPEEKRADKGHNSFNQRFLTEIKTLRNIESFHDDITMISLKRAEIEDTP